MGLGWGMIVRFNLPISLVRQQLQHDPLSKMTEQVWLIVKNLFDHE